MENDKLLKILYVYCYRSKSKKITGRATERKKKSKMVFKKKKKPKKVG